VTIDQRPTIATIAANRTTKMLMRMMRFMTGA
jgi:hypothetical protein